MNRRFISLINRVISFSPARSFLLVLHSGNKRTLCANGIKRNVEWKRFLICIYIESQHHSQSQVVLVEDNMSPIPHGFIAIQIVQVVVTSQNETVNKTRNRSRSLQSKNQLCILYNNNSLQPVYRTTPELLHLSVDTFWCFSLSKQGADIPRIS